MSEKMTYDLALTAEKIEGNVGMLCTSKGETRDRSTNTDSVVDRVRGVWLEIG